MDLSIKILPATNDVHGGVIVDLKEPMDSKDFATLLRSSLLHWKQQLKEIIIVSSLYLLYTMASSATEEQISLKVLVDEKKNRVVYAEAGKDFVDILLSFLFLKLALGTIARVVGKELNMNKVIVGSLSSLYDSVVWPM
ncbi:hypothetical protein JHK84_050901 [Glycine max]|nr:hypothetical protein JHK84_050901 [Glycine max]